MKKENIIQKKSFDFAVRAVNAYKYIIENKKEFILSKQFLRAATSIGANVEEAIGAQSSADFYSKLSTAYKEARETAYWIRLLFKTEYLSDTETGSLINDLDAILKIIGKIQISMKNRNS
jgi:four helix bundle protein